MGLVTLGEKGEGEIHHLLQILQAPAPGDFPAQRQAQGHADARPPTQNSAVPPQGKQFLDIEKIRAAPRGKPGGPAVRGQEEAVLVISRQGLSHPVSIEGGGWVKGSGSKGGHGGPPHQSPAPSPSIILPALSWAREELPGYKKSAIRPGPGRILSRFAVSGAPGPESGPARPFWVFPTNPIDAVKSRPAPPP